MATVLIVDDEKSIRTTLGLFLRSAGHQTIEAADAEEAIRVIEAVPLDVALLDILLGSGHGLDVARSIHERQPDVRTILITAEPTFATASHAIRLRAFDYLVKPLSREQILDVVGRAATAKANEQEYALLLQERERYREDLQRHVKERTAKLNQTAAELHALAARLQVVREDERTALARELHDDFGQNLTALQIDLDWLGRHMRAATPIDMARVQDRIAAMAPIVERLTEMTQAVCASLRPGMLDDLGLLAAIEWQVEDCQKRTGLTCEVSLPADDIALDRGRALALFRILQEAMTNVVRHAQATWIRVSLQSADHEIILEVRDNGRGFAPELFPGSKALGLLSMRERAASFQGTVDILSAPAQGTTVRVRMPQASGPSTGSPPLV